MSRAFCSITLTMMLALGTVVMAVPCTADPIPVDGGGFINLEFFLQTTITLVPGQTGFLQAAILNTGSVPLTFKPYDPTNPIGGFGWNFNDPGMALGDFGRVYSPSPLPNTLGFVSGRVSPVPLVTSPPPDYSHVSLLSIAPGEMLTFERYSITLASSVSLGLVTGIETASQIAFGDPIFAGFNTDKYQISIFAGSASQSGPLQQIGLTRFSFSPAEPPGGVRVSEPVSLLLVGMGLAGFAGARRARWV